MLLHSDLCRMIILNDCEDGEVEVAEAGIKMAFSGLSVESRGMAADVLMKTWRRMKSIIFYGLSLVILIGSFNLGTHILKRSVYDLSDELGDVDQMGITSILINNLSLPLIWLKSVILGR